MRVSRRAMVEILSRHPSWQYLRVGLLFLVIFGLFTKTAPGGANDASRMDEIEAIVEHHTLAIDHPAFRTEDRYRYKGRFYSDKPPVEALLAAPVYAVVHAFGFRFSHHDRLPYYLTTLLFVGLLSALALMAFRRIAIKSFAASAEWADLVTLMAGTATLWLPYSTVFNNHTVSGAFILLGVTPLLLPKSAGPRDAVLAGVLLSLAGAIDFTCFLFLPFVLVMFARRSATTAFIFAVACMPLTASYLVLNVLTSGSLLPPAMNAPLWAYPGSEFDPKTLSGLATHGGISDFAVYSLHMLVGKRGLIPHSPILMCSLAGLYLLLRDRTVFQRRAEFAWLLAACLVFMGLYLFRSTNYGGWAFGVRWFATPILILCLPLICLETRLRSSPNLRRLLFGIAVLSILISALGTVAPWTPDLTADTHVGFPSNSIVAVVRVLVHDSPAADKVRFLLGTALVFALLGSAWRRWYAAVVRPSSPDGQDRVVILQTPPVSEQSSSLHPFGGGH